VDLLVAGNAADMLPVPLSCTLPLRRIHPSISLLFLYFCGSNENNVWATEPDLHPRSQSVQTKQDPIYFAVVSDYNVNPDFPPFALLFLIVGHALCGGTSCEQL
jgi:hypothetical protein